ncbi:type IV pilin PilA [Pseudanabaena sp. lw0831]|uniref:type IV pilin-like G/H family protein n=1 Tax=Pseudanabaena sp. lw0831 TaxID=1357935 RepID=UPI001915B0B6|nr:type IV pilin-like G/H family protein [Pseudanabaena sp. lw0831]GBO52537.1 type IV pilin PilA [Pseudanabaena sp. lw0831]
MIRQVELNQPELDHDLVADLPQDTATPPKPKKARRWIMRLIIYGSLGFGLIALALPSFSGCGNKARSSEGRTYVGSMNRAQQAFWSEKQTFGRSIPALELGIKEETDNFKFQVQSFDLVTYQYGVPKNDNVKSFVGAVFVVPEKSQTSQGSNQKVNQTSESQPSAKKELTTVTILCESPKTGVKQKLPNPFLQNGTPTCAEGTVALN